MKSLESLIRIHRFQLDELRAELVRLEAERGALLTQADEIDIEMEVESARIHLGLAEAQGFSVWIGARLAHQAGLRRRAQDLDAEIEAQRDRVAEGFRELKTIELLWEEHLARAATERARRETAALDEAALTAHIRATRAG
ncbi:MAG: flagellar FliJ family protein [Alphaproteobacteria bacterium]|nr:flagellar FliJ family protein [Alphaproteobacteria bacterium]